MCFSSGAPDYTKKDYGPLPSLGTGSASRTVTLPTPVKKPRVVSRQDRDRSLLVGSNLDIKSPYMER